MRNAVVVLGILLTSLTSMARISGENDYCFSLSLDGRKITHIVLYSRDWENQVVGKPAPTINVRVFDYQSYPITVSVFDQESVDVWRANRNPPNLTYSASHHVVFSHVKPSGQKVSYDVKVNGVAQDIGGGITILRGQTEVLIDGQKVTMPNLKTLRWCPDPSNLMEIEEIESFL